jgi:hypothetical protein
VVIVYFCYTLLQCILEQLQREVSRFLAPKQILWFVDRKKHEEKKDADVFFHKGSFKFWGKPSAFQKELQLFRIYVTLSYFFAFLGILESGFRSIYAVCIRIKFRIPGPAPDPDPQHCL